MRMPVVHLAVRSRPNGSPTTDSVCSAHNQRPLRRVHVEASAARSVTGLPSTVGPRVPLHVAGHHRQRVLVRPRLPSVWQCRVRARFLG